MINIHFSLHTYRAAWYLSPCSVTLTKTKYDDDETMCFPEFCIAVIYISRCTFLLTPDNMTSIVLIALLIACKYNNDNGLDGTSRWYEYIPHCLTRGVLSPYVDRHSGRYMIPGIQHMFAYVGNVSLNDLHRCEVHMCVCVWVFRNYCCYTQVAFLDNLNFSLWTPVTEYVKVSRLFTRLHKNEDDVKLKRESPMFLNVA